MVPLREKRKEKKRTRVVWEFAKLWESGDSSLVTTIYEVGCLCVYKYCSQQDCQRQNYRKVEKHASLSLRLGVHG